MNEKLEKANYLQEEIRKLEHFLSIVVTFDEKSMAIPSTNVLMTKKVDVKISPFGSRFFGIGTHIQEIEVPNQIRNGLIELVKEKLQELNEKLNSMLC